MNKKTITFALCLASATTLTAQNQPGGISSVTEVIPCRTCFGERLCFEQHR